jgi:hypothetical protein
MWLSDFGLTAALAMSPHSLYYEHNLIWPFLDCRLTEFCLWRDCSVSRPWLSKRNSCDAETKNCVWTSVLGAYTSGKDSIARFYASASQRRACISKVLLTLHQYRGDVYGGLWKTKRTCTKTQDILRVKLVEIYGKVTLSQMIIGGRQRTWDSVHIHKSLWFCFFLEFLINLINILFHVLGMNCKYEKHLWLSTAFYIQIH